MRALLALVVVAGLVQPVAAESSSILVLQTEGRADAGTRAKIDAALIDLARTATPEVAPGDITFADAAAAVGCDATAPACRDEVLGMLAVDEIVYATVTPKPGGLEVHVRRVTRGGLTREATMTVPTGSEPDTLAGVAPLFGGAPAPQDPTTASTSTSTTAPTEPTPTELAPTEPGPPPLVGEPAAPVITTTASSGPADLPRARVRRWPVIGMVGGGTMVVIGFMLWGQAGDLRDEIDAAPTNTLPQLQELAELEDRGDSYASWGNLMFLGGAVLGGISTYYFLKDRKRARAVTARITPTVFDRGAGLALTIGGLP